MKTFGELDRNDKLVLFAAWIDGKDIEYKPGNSTWVETKSPAWTNDLAYRIKTVKPSINWDHVDTQWNFLAIDKYGDETLYTNKPHVCSANSEWSMPNGESETFNGLFASFERGKCSWEDSLISRLD